MSSQHPHTHTKTSGIPRVSIHYWKGCEETAGGRPLIFERFGWILESVWHTYENESPQRIWPVNRSASFSPWHLPLLPLHKASYTLPGPKYEKDLDFIDLVDTVCCSICIFNYSNDLLLTHTFIWLPRLYMFYLKHDITDVSLSIS